MADEIVPYIAHESGDVINAEDWNEIQRKIKGDINKVQTSVDQIQKNGVDKAGKAGDADKFGGKTPDKWNEELDGRYVQHSELKSGWGEYRRYFKQLDDLSKPAIIEHNLHRYPLVNVFELQALNAMVDSVVESPDSSSQVNFFLYYEGHIDLAAGKLKSGNYKHTGDSLDRIMAQVGMSKDDDQLFEDFLNDLWGKMFDTGNEEDHFEIESCAWSKWIQEKIITPGKTVGQIFNKDKTWDNLRIAIRPQMIPVGHDITQPRVIKKTEVPLTKNEIELPTTYRVDVCHISQDALEIDVSKPMALMILLRT